MKRLLILSVILASVFSSCSGKGGDVLHEVLSHKELVTARKLVYAYDDFILRQVPKSDVPIEEAYATFLQFNAPFAKAAMSADNFRPAAIRMVDVFNDLGTRNVKHFLVFDRKCESLRIAGDGEYAAVLEKLASRREIFGKMLENLDASGNTVDGDWLVIDEFGSIDFSREDERFVFMLNVLSMPQTQLPL